MFDSFVKSHSGESRSLCPIENTGLRLRGRNDERGRFQPLYEFIMLGWARFLNSKRVPGDKLPAFWCSKDYMGPG